MEAMCDKLREELNVDLPSIQQKHADKLREVKEVFSKTKFLRFGDYLMMRRAGFTGAFKLNGTIRVSPGTYARPMRVSMNVKYAILKEDDVVEAERLLNTGMWYIDPFFEEYEDLYERDIKIRLVSLKDEYGAPRHGYASFRENHLPRAYGRDVPLEPKNDIITVGSENIEVPNGTGEYYFDVIMNEIKKGWDEYGVL